MSLAQQDAAAYDGGGPARHMPKESDEQSARHAPPPCRRRWWTRRIPLRAAVVASEVLDLAERIAPIGNRNAASDAGVAAQLAARRPARRHS